MSKKDRAAAIIRRLQNDPAHRAKFGCMYGVHPYIEDDPEWGYKRCPNCNAVYTMPKLWEKLAMEEVTEEDAEQARRYIETQLLNLVDEGYATCEIINGTRYYRADKNESKLLSKSGTSTNEDVGGLGQGRGCIQGI